MYMNVGSSSTTRIVPGSSRGRTTGGGLAWPGEPPYQEVQVDRDPSELGGQGLARGAGGGPGLDGRAQDRQPGGAEEAARRLQPVGGVGDGLRVAGRRRSPHVVDSRGRTRQEQPAHLPDVLGAEVGDQVGEDGLVDRKSSRGCGRS